MPSCDWRLHKLRCSTTPFPDGRDRFIFWKQRSKPPAPSDVCRISKGYGNLVSAPCELDKSNISALCRRRSQSEERNDCCWFVGFEQLCTEIGYSTLFGLCTVYNNIHGAQLHETNRSLRNTTTPRFRDSRSWSLLRNVCCCRDSKLTYIRQRIRDMMGNVATQRGP